MHSNENMIRLFYTCFQNKDYKGMQACYADDAVFSDAVFVSLNAKQVKAMWKMLCKRGKDLQLNFDDVKADDAKGSAEWTASYTFSATGRYVVNIVQAKFEFKDGKIIRHTDTFSFSRWAAQALGITGLLFGMTTFLKLKVRAKAMDGLQDFMNKN